VGGDWRTESERERGGENAVRFNAPWEELSISVEN
jgi:hypothetical protein